MSNLQNRLKKYTQDPLLPDNNFHLGHEYEKIKQTASALTFYLRAAELTDDNKLAYFSLLRAAECLITQPKRIYSTKGLVLHAIALFPDKPEGFHLLSKIYEMSGEWQESYTAAVSGLKFAKNSFGDFDGYPGEYALLFQKAVAAWWIWRVDESLETFRDLAANYEMSVEFQRYVHNNLRNLDKDYYGILPYDRGKLNQLRYKFNNVERIDKNYSQTYQDMFVLSMLDGKENGTYLEIGSADPFHNNNTALLETQFNWSGISIDIDTDEVDKFLKERKNLVLAADATKIDYANLLKKNNIKQNVDYLQIDCEPSETTYNVLLSIPFDDYKFGVITYEHDYYADESKSFRDKSRDYLKSLGYELIVNNIAPNSYNSYEDWWVHPDLVDREIINQMRYVSDEIKQAEEYMLRNMKMSVPVIGTAVVNSAKWLKRLIESVDYPVDNFFIVNNNGRGELDKDLDEIVKTNHKFIKKITVTHLPANIGVSGAWNMIIKCFMNAPYWIITNDDVSFGKGFLEEMSSVANSDPEVGIIHGHKGDFNAGSWDLFLIRDHIIQEFGLFDENLYPGYNEDADYIMRTILKPIKKVMSIDKMYYHGTGEKDDYHTHGSQTKKTDPSLEKKLNRANEMNIEYLNEKWGPDWRTCAPCEHPFGKDDLPSSYTKYDLKFVRSKNLGF